MVITAAGQDLDSVHLRRAPRCHNTSLMPTWHSPEVTIYHPNPPSIYLHMLLKVHTMYLTIEGGALRSNDPTYLTRLFFFNSGIGITLCNLSSWESILESRRTLTSVQRTNIGEHTKNRRSTKCSVFHLLNYRRNLEVELWSRNITVQYRANTIASLHDI